MIEFTDLRWIVVETYGLRHVFYGTYDTIEEATKWAEKLSRQNLDFPHNQSTFHVESISTPVET